MSEFVYFVYNLTLQPGPELLVLLSVRRTGLSLTGRGGWAGGVDKCVFGSRTGFKSELGSGRCKFFFAKKNIYVRRASEADRRPTVNSRLILAS